MLHLKPPRHTPTLRIPAEDQVEVKRLSAALVTTILAAGRQPGCTRDARSLVPQPGYQTLRDRRARAGGPDRIRTCGLCLRGAAARPDRGLRDIVDPVVSDSEERTGIRFEKERVYGYSDGAKRCRQTLSPGGRADPGLASVRGRDSLAPSKTRRVHPCPSNLPIRRLVLLAAAAERKDLFLIAPPTLKGATAQKVASKLISAGFVKEVKAKASGPIWRRDEEDQGRPMRSSSPPRAPKRSRSVTPPSLMISARKAMRSRTVIRQRSRQSWTPTTFDLQKR